MNVELDEYATDFLSVATSDHEAALLLYQNGLYPQALYFLQQSVEKLTKAFFLMRLSVNSDEEKSPLEIERELKEIGHHPLRFHIRAMREKVKSLEECIAQSAILPDDPFVGDLLTTCAEGITALQEEIIQLKSINNKHEFSPPTNEIDGYLNELRQKESELEELYSYLKEATDTDEFLYELMQNALEFSYLAYLNHKSTEKLHSDYLLILTTKKEDLQATYRDDFEIRKELSYIGKSLRVLGMLTFQYVMYARYPNMGRKHNPLKKYDGKYPHIQTFPELHAEVLIIIEKMNKVQKYGLENMQGEWSGAFLIG